MMADRVLADFGSTMKRTREARGVSLREIASATKLSVSALEALERNDIARLPGGIFTRGFVRSYAAEIGLDPEQTVREFLTQFPHDSVTAGSPYATQEDHAAIESDRRSAENALKLIGISLPIAGAILYFTLTYSSSLAKVEAPEQVTASAATASPGTVEERAPVADAPGAPGAPAALPKPVDVTFPPLPRPFPPAVAPLTFEIIATGPVSVEVEVDGVRRESRAIAAGERIVVRADRAMTLTMSDAGAVQLTINNQPAVALGSSGEQRTIQIGRNNYWTFLVQ